LAVLFYLFIVEQTLRKLISRKIPAGQKDTSSCPPQNNTHHTIGN